MVKHMQAIVFITVACAGGYIMLKYGLTFG